MITVKVYSVVTLRILNYIRIERNEFHMYKTDVRAGRFWKLKIGSSIYVSRKNVRFMSPQMKVRCVTLNICSAHTRYFQ